MAARVRLEDNALDLARACLRSEEHEMNSVVGRDSLALMTSECELFCRTRENRQQLMAEARLRQVHVRLRHFLEVKL